MIRSVCTRGNVQGAVEVSTNTQRGKSSGSCRLCRGLDKAHHVVLIASIVRVNASRKSLHMAVEGPSTRPVVFSMIPGSYCRRRRRFTIFVSDK